MTLRERKKYRNWLLIGLLAFIVLRLFMMSTQKEAEKEGKVPRPAWKAVESVSILITGILIVALLIILAPTVPFIAPWIFYGLAIAATLYTLYYSVLRWGSSSSMLPDNIKGELSANESIFTRNRDKYPPMFVPNMNYN